MCDALGNNLWLSNLERFWGHDMTNALRVTPVADCIEQGLHRFLECFTFTSDATVTT